MSTPVRRARFTAVRAVRHGLLATALVLLVCAGVAVVSWRSLSTLDGTLTRLTARGSGQITQTTSDAVTVTWPLPDGRAATARVPLAVTAPPAGTRADIAYDPRDPGTAVVPGAQVLADADRARGGIAFSALVAVAVLLAGAWRVLTRARATRAPARRLLVRRVRVQSGLLTRSWLETESAPERWIPVYYDPVLVALPAPAEVELHGDPRRDRLVAARVPGPDGPVWLYPSGPVTARHPRGRRGDSPTQPDPDQVARAHTGLARQLRADAVLVIPAPFVGLFWAYLDGSGFTGWLGATTVAAALGLWLAAWRGSDPS
jgi:hypothetical protein